MSVVSANNNALSAISALPSAVAGGGLNLISTQTASSSATLSFTSGIDSTYKKYVFKFINIHPATDEAHFTVGFRDGGTAYDATKTTSYILSYHAEDDSETSLAYHAAGDLAQGTGFQRILHGVGNGNDESASGYLHLFDPSSTTFVKHFIAGGSSYNAGSYEYTTYVAGYNNVTAAIDGVQFKMSSGNIDSGVVKLYGVS
jgi:hypothetical protein